MSFLLYKCVLYYGKSAVSFRLIIGLTPVICRTPEYKPYTLSPNVWQTEVIRNTTPDRAILRPTDLPARRRIFTLPAVIHLPLLNYLTDPSTSLMTLATYG